MFQARPCPPTPQPVTSLQLLDMVLPSWPVDVTFAHCAWCMLTQAAMQTGGDDSLQCEERATDGQAVSVASKRPRRQKRDRESCREPVAQPPRYRRAVESSSVHEASAAASGSSSEPAGHVDDGRQSRHAAIIRRLYNASTNTGCSPSSNAVATAHPVPATTLESQGTYDVLLNPLACYSRVGTSFADAASAGDTARRTTD